MNHVAADTLYVNLAIYFTGSVCLFATGHWIGGAVLLAAFGRVALITGL